MKALLLLFVWGFVGLILIITLQVNGEWVKIPYNDYDQNDISLNRTNEICKGIECTTIQRLFF